MLNFRIDVVGKETLFLDLPVDILEKNAMAFKNIFDLVDSPTYKISSWNGSSWIEILKGGSCKFKPGKEISFDSNKFEFTQHTQKEELRVKKNYHIDGCNYEIIIESKDPSSNNAFIELDRTQMIRLSKMIETLLEY